MFSPAIIDPVKSVNSITVGARTMTRDQVESPIKPVEPLIPGNSAEINIGPWVLCESTGMFSDALPVASVVTDCKNDPSTRISICALSTN